MRELLVLGVALAAFSACEPAGASIRGAELAVTAVEKLELWQGATAPPGHHYVVVHLHVDATRVVDQITLSGFGLRNADGSMGSTELTELTLAGGAEHHSELGFSILKRLRPRALLVENAEMELPPAFGW